MASYHYEPHDLNTNRLRQFKRGSLFAALNNHIEVLKDDTYVHLNFKDQQAKWTHGMSNSTYCSTISGVLGMLTRFYESLFSCLDLMHLYSCDQCSGTDVVRHWALRYIEASMNQLDNGERKRNADDFDRRAVKKNSSKRYTGYSLDDLLETSDVRANSFKSLWSDKKAFEVVFGRKTRNFTVVEGTVKALITEAYEIVVQEIKSPPVTPNIDVNRISSFQDLPLLPVSFGHEEWEAVVKALGKASKWNTPDLRVYMTSLYQESKARFKKRLEDVAKAKIEQQKQARAAEAEKKRLEEMDKAEQAEIERKKNRHRSYFEEEESSSDEERPAEGDVGKEPKDSKGQGHSSGGGDKAGQLGNDGGAGGNNNNGQTPNDATTEESILAKETVYQLDDEISRDSGRHFVEAFYPKYKYWFKNAEKNAHWIDALKAMTSANNLEARKAADKQAIDNLPQCTNIPDLSVLRFISMYSLGLHLPFFASVDNQTCGHCPFSGKFSSTLLAGYVSHLPKLLSCKNTNHMSPSDLILHLQDKHKDILQYLLKYLELLYKNTVTYPYGIASKSFTNSAFHEKYSEQWSIGRSFELLSYIKSREIKWGIDYRGRRLFTNTCPFDTILCTFFIIVAANLLSTEDLNQSQDTGLKAAIYQMFRNDVLLARLLHLQDFPDLVQEDRKGKAKWNSMCDIHDVYRTNCVGGFNRLNLSLVQKCNSEDCPNNKRVKRRERGLLTVGGKDDLKDIGAFVNSVFAKREVPCMIVADGPAPHEKNVPDPELCGHHVPCKYNGTLTTYCKLADGTNFPPILDIKTSREKNNQLLKATSVMTSLDKITYQFSITVEDKCVATYRLIAVILHNGSHFRSIILDTWEKGGNNLFYDGLGVDSNGCTIKFVPYDHRFGDDGYDIIALWYTKIDPSNPPKHRSNFHKMMGIKVSCESMKDLMEKSWLFEKSDKGKFIPRYEKKPCSQVDPQVPAHTDEERPSADKTLDTNTNVTLKDPPELLLDLNKPPTSNDSQACEATDSHANTSNENTCSNAKKYNNTTGSENPNKQKPPTSNDSQACEATDRHANTSNDTTSSNANTNDGPNNDIDDDRATDGTNENNANNDNPDDNKGFRADDADDPKSAGPTEEELRLTQEALNAINQAKPPLKGGFGGVRGHERDEDYWEHPPEICAPQIILKHANSQEASHIYMALSPSVIKMLVHPIYQWDITLLQSLISMLLYAKRGSLEANKICLSHEVVYVTTEVDEDAYAEAINREAVSLISKQERRRNAQSNSNKTDEIDIDVIRLQAAENVHKVYRVLDIRLHDNFNEIWNRCDQVIMPVICPVYLLHLRDVSNHYGLITITKGTNGEEAAEIVCYDPYGTFKQQSMAQGMMESLSQKVFPVKTPVFLNGKKKLTKAQQKKRNSICVLRHIVTEGSANCRDHQSCGPRLLVHLIGHLKDIIGDDLFLPDMFEHEDPKFKGAVLWMRLLLQFSQNWKHWNGLDHCKKFHVLTKDGTILSGDDRPTCDLSLRTLSLKFLSECTASEDNMMRIHNYRCGCHRVVLIGEPRVVFPCCFHEMHALCFKAWISELHPLKRLVCPQCLKLVELPNMPVLVPPSGEMACSDSTTLIQFISNEPNMGLEFALNPSQSSGGIESVLGKYHNMDFCKPTTIPKQSIVQLARLVIGVARLVNSTPDAILSKFLDQATDCINEFARFLYSEVTNGNGESYDCLVGVEKPSESDIYDRLNKIRDTIINENLGIKLDIEMKHQIEQTVKEKAAEGSEDEEAQTKSISADKSMEVDSPVRQKDEEEMQPQSGLEALNKEGANSESTGDVESVQKGGEAQTQSLPLNKEGASSEKTGDEDNLDGKDDVQTQKTGDVEDVPSQGEAQPKQMSAKRSEHEEKQTESVPLNKEGASSEKTGDEDNPDGKDDVQTQNTGDVKDVPNQVEAQPKPIAAKPSEDENKQTKSVPKTQNKEKVTSEENADKNNVQTQNDTTEKHPPTAPSETVIFARVDSIFKDADKNVFTPRIVYEKLADEFGFEIDKEMKTKIKDRLKELNDDRLAKLNEETQDDTTEKHPPTAPSESKKRKHSSAEARNPKRRSPRSVKNQSQHSTPSTTAVSSRSRKRKASEGFGTASKSSQKRKKNQSPSQKSDTPSGFALHRFQEKLQTWGMRRLKSLFFAFFPSEPKTILKKELLLKLKTHPGISSSRDKWTWYDVPFGKYSFADATEPSSVPIADVNFNVICELYKRYEESSGFFGTRVTVIAKDEVVHRLAFIGDIYSLSDQTPSQPKYRVGTAVQVKHKNGFSMCFGKVAEVRSVSSGHEYTVEFEKNSDPVKYSEAQLSQVIAAEVIGMGGHRFVPREGLGVECFYVDGYRNATIVSATNSLAHVRLDGDCVSDGTVEFPYYLLRPQNIPETSDVMELNPSNKISNDGSVFVPEKGMRVLIVGRKSNHSSGKILEVKDTSAVIGFDEGSEKEYDYCCIIPILPMTPRPIRRKQKPDAYKPGVQPTCTNHTIDNILNGMSKDLRKIISRRTTLRCSRSGNDDVITDDFHEYMHNRISEENQGRSSPCVNIFDDGSWKQQAYQSKCNRFDGVCDILSKFVVSDHTTDLLAVFRLGHFIDMSSEMDIHIANASLMSFHVVHIPSCYKQSFSANFAHNLMHGQSPRDDTLPCDDCSAEVGHDLLLVIHGYPTQDHSCIPRLVQGVSEFTKQFRVICATTFPRRFGDTLSLSNMKGNDTSCEHYKFIAPRMLKYIQSIALKVGESSKATAADFKIIPRENSAETFMKSFLENRVDTKKTRSMFNRISSERLEDICKNSAMLGEYLIETKTVSGLSMRHLMCQCIEQHRILFGSSASNCSCIESVCFQSIFIYIGHDNKFCLGCTVCQSRCMKDGHDYNSLEDAILDTWRVGISHRLHSFFLDPATDESAHESSVIPIRFSCNYQRRDDVIECRPNFDHFDSCLGDDQMLVGAVKSEASHDCHAKMGSVFEDILQTFKSSYASEVFKEVGEKLLSISRKGHAYASDLFTLESPVHHIAVANVDENFGAEYCDEDKLKEMAVLSHVNQIMMVDWQDKSYTGLLPQPCGNITQEQIDEMDNIMRSSPGGMFQNFHSFGALEDFMIYADANNNKCDLLREYSKLPPISYSHAFSKANLCSDPYTETGRSRRIMSSKTYICLSQIEASDPIVTKLENDNQYSVERTKDLGSNLLNVTYVMTDTIIDRLMCHNKTCKWLHELEHAKWTKATNGVRDQLMCFINGRITAYDPASFTLSNLFPYEAVVRPKENHVTVQTVLSFAEMQFALANATYWGSIQNEQGMEIMTTPSLASEVNIWQEASSSQKSGEDQKGYLSSYKPIKDTYGGSPVTNCGSDDICANDPSKKPSIIEESGITFQYEVTPDEGNCVHANISNTFDCIGQLDKHIQLLLMKCATTAVHEDSFTKFLSQLDGYNAICFRKLDTQHLMGLASCMHLPAIVSTKLRICSSSTFGHVFGICPININKLGLVDGSRKNTAPLEFTEEGLRWCLSNVSLDGLLFSGAFILPGKRRSRDIINSQGNTNSTVGNTNSTVCLHFQIDESHRNIVKHSEADYRKIMTKYLESD